MKALSTCVFFTLALTACNTIEQPSKIAEKHDATKQKFQEETVISFNSLLQQAENDEASAVFKLALIYELGWDIKNPRFTLNDGDVFLTIPFKMSPNTALPTDISVQPDANKAIYWYEKLAKSDNVATLRLANLYAEGRSTKDYIRAKELYEHLANQNVVQAKYNLAMLYLYGFIEDKEGNQVAFWLSQACEKSFMKKPCEKIQKSK